MLGIAPIIMAFELKDVVAKIKAILDIGHADFRITDDLLMLIEASMQQMLLCAILVEGEVGAMTGRFAFAGGPSDAANAAYKAPIVARIHKYRAAMQQEDIASSFIHLPTDGYWPPGL
jgi:hypothetical protein